MSTCRPKKLLLFDTVTTCRQTQKMLALRAYNSANKSRFLTKPVPLESPLRALSNGTGFVTNRSLLAKLRGVKVETMFMT